MKTIVEIINENNGRIDFDESLTVKMSPHQPPEKIVSVQIDGFNVFYTDKDGVNKFLSDKNVNVINSLRQRILLMKHDGKL